MHTHDENTLPTAPPSLLDRFDSLGWVFVLAGLMISVVFGLLSDGIYMNDDATHYFIAKEGFTDAKVLLHRWGRVGYTLPTSPIAYWFGFAGCRIFSAIQTALLSLLAWRIARRLIGPGLAAASAALLVWMQPLTFLLSMTTLTETTGALYLLLAMFLYVRGNRLWSCLVFSALFLARDESLALAPLIVLALLIDAYRKAGNSFRGAICTWWVWIGSLLLTTGPVLYVLASLPVDLPPDGDPLQIFTRHYSAEYGKGPLYWMTTRWCEQATPSLVAMAVTGAILLLRAVWRKEPMKQGHALPAGAWLVATWAIAYTALHSVLFHRGLFAHGGEARYMVPIAGLTAVLGAVCLHSLLTARSAWIPLLFSLLLAGLIWLPLLVFRFVWNSLWWPIQYGLIAATIFVLLLAVIPLVRRTMQPKRIGLVLVVLATVLTLSQLQFYFHPISLDQPLDPLDKLLATAARQIQADHLEARPILSKHPLIRFLLPDSQLRWCNEKALSQWQENPPGAIFIWDSKNCNWPDPAEQETNALLLETLQSQAEVKLHITETSSAYKDPMQVIVFEKK